MDDCQEAIDKLTEQLEKAREEIEELKDKLKQIEETASEGNDRAVSRMNGGNVPMRAYEYCFGSSSAFLEILSLLDVRGSKPNRSLKAKLFSGFGGFKRILR